MVNVDESFPSDYVQVGEDVSDGDFLTFVDGGRTETNEKWGKLQLIFKVKTPKGDEKLCNVNKTSMKSLKEAWGADTSGWQGKKVLVSVVRQNVGGELKDVMYFTEAKDEAATAAPATAAAPAPAPAPAPAKEAAPAKEEEKKG